MNSKIWLSPPHLTGEEQKHIQKAFVSNWIAPLGPNVDAFEKEICNFTKSSYCTTTNSATAGIHLALKVIGVKKGDLILCPTFTFIASTNPIKYVQAEPVFIDSEKNTLNMCPILLEKAIIDLIKLNKKPKAIILVHSYGTPAKLDHIISISKKYNIPVIEDAANSLGSTHNNKHLGTFGEIGVFSFNGNKIITTSGGGAMISNNQNYIEEASFLANQAKENSTYYLHKKIGYNYRMSNVLAGIGLGQLEVIHNRIDSRRFNYQYYQQKLNKITDIQFIKEQKNNYSNRWLTVILTKSKSQRNKIKSALLKNNIESRHLWNPMHKQPVYKNNIKYINGNAEYFFNVGLCLPSGSNLSKEDLNRVINVIKSCF